MSFDIFLHRFKSGQSIEIDRSKIFQLVDELRKIAPDRYGQYDIALPSGAQIRLSASGLASSEVFKGCAFHLRDFTPEYCDFILKLARAGDLVIFNAQGLDEPANPVLILSEQEQSDQVPVGMYKHPVVALSGLHLYTILDGTFSAWEAFRNQVTQQVRSGQ